MKLTGLFVFGRRTNRRLNVVLCVYAARLGRLAQLPPRPLKRLRLRYL
ncbi:hypothetical protein [Paraburkholderia fungorum]|nr:hypothetical protein [Paraburkholderia fungorum]MBU7436492.1 hypothetical protein [Paraburkholderia fungorum]